jgi:hypothetical protein
VVAIVAMTSATVASSTDWIEISPTASTGERSDIHAEIAIIAIRPLPMTKRKGPSKPKGMASALNTANGMTISETIGMTARLASRLSGDTR